MTDIIDAAECILKVAIIITFYTHIFHNNGVDTWDSIPANYSRGMLGGIYDAEGNFDIWSSMMDFHPVYGLSLIHI